MSCAPPPNIESLTVPPQCQSFSAVPVSEIGSNQSVLPRQIMISSRLHYLSALQRATINCWPHSCGLPSISKARHNVGLKCLYFTLLKHYGLVNKIPPWHTAIVVQLEVKNDQVRILSDVPTHTAECRIQATSNRGNRPDVTGFDKQAQEVLVVELSSPWVTNRIKKDEEKTAKSLGVFPYIGYTGTCRWKGYGFQAIWSGIGPSNHRKLV